MMIIFKKYIEKSKDKRIKFANNQQLKIKRNSIKI